MRQGKFQSGIEQGGCDDCAVGQHQDETGKRCKACTAGRYRWQRCAHCTACGLHTQPISTIHSAAPSAVPSVVNAKACLGMYCVSAGSRQGVAGTQAVKHVISARTPTLWVPGVQEPQWLQQVADQTAQPSCKDARVCSVQEFETVAPTAITDRRCSSHTTCKSDEFESTAAGARHDRVCIKHEVCDLNTHWISRRAGRFHDRECKRQTHCGAGQRMAAEATRFADRVCVPCDENSFKPHAGDSDCLKCPKGFKARADRLSCQAVQCSHVTCRHEEHQCSRFNRDPTARGRGKFQFGFDAEECDGRTHRSIRVMHDGALQHLCRITAKTPYDCPMWVRAVMATTAVWVS